MSDFEDVFGAGADADAIIDGFSRSAERERKEELEERRGFDASVFLDARIDAFGYSLHLKNREEVAAFDTAVQATPEQFRFSFTRTREGVGDRVVINPASHETYFRRPGHIVVTKSLEEAKVLAATTGAPVFTTSASGLDGAFSKIFDAERYGSDLNKVSRDLYLEVTSSTSTKELSDAFVGIHFNPAKTKGPSIFDHLDAGRRVVVCGRRLELVLEMRSRFIGWSMSQGFSHILDKRTLLSYRLERAAWEAGSPHSTSGHTSANETCALVFSSFQEALAWARINPGRAISRNARGNGFIVVSRNDRDIDAQ